MPPRSEPRPTRRWVPVLPPAAPASPHPLEPPGLSPPISAPPTTPPSHEALNNPSSLLGHGDASVAEVELPPTPEIAEDVLAALPAAARAVVTLDNIIDQASGWFPPDEAAKCLALFALLTPLALGLLAAPASSDFWSPDR